MFVRKMGNRGFARRVLVLSLHAGILSGCGTSIVPDRSNGARPTLSLAALNNNASTFFEGDPNNAFGLAESVVVATQSRNIRGHIDGPDDVDVYNLGPARPGDRILVRMTNDNTLDPDLALFDDTGALLLVNDHRNIYLGQREPFLDVIVQDATDACYVAVSATPGFRAVGDYGLAASKEHAPAIPSPRPDTILLVFGGGARVKIGSRPAASVPPFDATTIDPAYAGKTEEMIREIIAQVRQDYEGYDLIILSTSEGAVFDGKMSRLFFGTFDPGLLGVAEGVDEFNASSSQEAIVFTDTFAAFVQLEPSVAEMSQALANVASHEIGHLLGLVHTRDTLGIMDITASLQGLLEDQTFRRSPIHEAVFPLGDQDASRLLLESIGGNAAFIAAKNANLAKVVRAVPPSVAGPPCRQRFYLSTCDLNEP